MIDTPYDMQKKRATHRDKVNKQQIDDIINTQLSREARNQKADDIIMNIGSVEDLQQAVTSYHYQLLEKVNTLWQ